MSVLVRSALWLCCVAAFGADRWSAPVLGFVFDDASKALFSVTGVPGAASLDRAVAIPSKIDRAAVAWGARPWAIVRGADGTTSVAVWTGSDVRLTRLEGAVSWTDAAWSGADHVALWNRESGEVQLWRGAAGSPAIAMETGISGVQTVAVSDAGALAAASPHQLHIRRGDQVSRFDIPAIAALAWRANDLMIAQPDRLSIFSNDQLHPLAHLPPGSTILALSPTGDNFLTCADGKPMWGGLQPNAT